MAEGRPISGGDYELQLAAAAAMLIIGATALQAIMMHLRQQRDPDYTADTEYLMRSTKIRAVVALAASAVFAALDYKYMRGSEDETPLRLLSVSSMLTLISAALRFEAVFGADTRDTPVIDELSVDDIDD